MSCVFSVAASGKDSARVAPQRVGNHRRGHARGPGVPSATPISAAASASRFVHRLAHDLLQRDPVLDRPPGLANSHLISTSHPVASLSDATRIMGVLPTTSSTENATGRGAFRFFRGPDPRRAFPRRAEEARARRRPPRPSGRTARPARRPRARRPAPRLRSRKRKRRWFRGQTRRRDGETISRTRALASVGGGGEGDASERGPSRRTRGGASERAYPLRSQRWTDPAYPSFLDPRTLGRAPRARPSDDASPVGTLQKIFRQVFEIFSQVSDQTSAKGFTSNPTAHHRVPRRRCARPAAVPAARSRVRASRRLSRPRADALARSIPTAASDRFRVPSPCEHGVRPQRGVGALPGHGRGPQRRGDASEPQRAAAAGLVFSLQTVMKLITLHSPRDRGTLDFAEFTNVQGFLRNIQASFQYFDSAERGAVQVGGAARAAPRRVRARRRRRGQVRAEQAFDPDCPLGLPLENPHANAVSSPRDVSRRRARPQAPSHWTSTSSCRCVQDLRNRSVHL